MKKVPKTARNWLLLAFLSYVLVSVLMGLGLAFSAKDIAGRWVAFFSAFTAPFIIVKHVILQPGNGRMWMGLGSVAFLLSSCLWILSRTCMESPIDERERERLERLKKLRPSYTSKQNDSSSPE